MTGAGFSPNESLSELRTTPAITYCRSRFSQPPPERLGVRQESAHELLVDDRLRAARPYPRTAAKSCPRAAESPSSGSSPA